MWNYFIAIDVIVEGGTTRGAGRGNMLRKIDDRLAEEDSWVLVGPDQMIHCGDHSCSYVWLALYSHSSRGGERAVVRALSGNDGNLVQCREGDKSKEMRHRQQGNGDGVLRENPKLLDR
ncbi:hypothetical protein L1887_35599 [Cichorium endivia]|nr:hypothetical protein L1887_35599 [Cichorium endivia]